ncbi:type IV pilus biogenesis protein PilM [Pseudomonas aeruginosa]|nr:type IV pilus biogenesis protein PilM [Pseudomonas aeruginosa]
MPLMWIVLVLALITGTWLSVQSNHATSSAELAEVDTLARSLLLYRSRLAEYAHANPGFSGSPADSALGLPAWFRKPCGFRATSPPAPATPSSPRRRRGWRRPWMLVRNPTWLASGATTSWSRAALGAHLPLRSLRPSPRARWSRSNNLHRPVNPGAA